MSLDLPLALGGLLVGLVVGLTGMGGGALMTPMLVFFAGIERFIAASLLVGAIPGAWLGAQVSSRAPGGLIRRILAVLLLASGLRLLGVPTEWVLASVALLIVLGIVAWVVIRERAVRTVAGAAAPDGARIDVSTS